MCLKTPTCQRTASGPTHDRSWTGWAPASWLARDVKKNLTPIGRRRASLIPGPSGWPAARKVLSTSTPGVNIAMDHIIGEYEQQNPAWSSCRFQSWNVRDRLISRAVKAENRRGDIADRRKRTG